jgi:hypothetical protein
MCTRFGVAAVIGLVLSAASTAAPIRFDFGNGNISPDTGVAANVVIADNAPLGTETETISGVTITLDGIVGPAGGTWTSTQNGIGIETVDQAGTAAGRQRIDGTIGEFVNFSFDVDVTIDSIRLGNMVDDTVEIAFVSGTDPFAGGSFTYSTPAGPTDDIHVGVFVTAGTVLSLAASVPDQQGVLWNDVVVTPIPEPSTIAMIGVVAACVAALRQRRFEQWPV